jgi:dihydroorotate dehydrogenase
MNIYKALAKPLLFRLNPDLVHEMITSGGELLGKNAYTQALLKKNYYFEHPNLKTEVFGISFNNPVGIAGGFDKDAKLIQTLPAIGFGFTEVGSITAEPYAGNKKPWNIRLIDDKSILVNYGLKNQGAAVLLKKIQQQKRSVPLIINIAKTNDPRVKGIDSVEDYYKSVILLAPIADIINLNISCPNTGDGTLFCESPKLLKMLLDRLAHTKIDKPVVLKIKPDLSDKLLNEVICLPFPINSSKVLYCQI